MPKKTRKISKQAQGWITRRARMKASKEALDQPNPIDHQQSKTSMVSRMRALRNAPLPAAVLLDGPLMPIGKKSSDDFAAEITLAARKKGGTEAVARMIECHISTVKSDAGDEAWRMHHRIQQDQETRRRNRVISDFLMMATQHAGQVTLLGSTTMQAIVEALEQAGYTKHGLSPCAENAATDTKAVR